MLFPKSNIFRDECQCNRSALSSLGARATSGNGDISRGEHRPAWLAEIRRDGDRQQLVHGELLQG